MPGDAPLRVHGKARKISFLWVRTCSMFSVPPIMGRSVV
ncbi:hypothetical protein ALP82_102955 [Pseudomonas savastanoi pv. fraxini]|uniref:Uncharacterized protein n=1 Tax=Pseudomonas savastanoi pv. nerii TaxID=360921 RepID=A0A3M5NTC4_PSESS|nr:hypothetical protein AC519_3424 [Pseudomonas savastanoi]KPY39154.1 hypothetical protein ALO49_102737 [Pseudomonas savastanoi pv. retacarpa]KPY65445.1 hypothetical protein ALO58_102688 [Pseudomonas savastanoi pv. savastanoi]RMR69435.1 hypothetical protein ALP82_102955 [Pseudomonas savastanoi pv. fraxini]RMT73009.1 hypothetical protein ALP42_102830 [Pseudomonas savastanoi pv. nerii]